MSGTWDDIRAGAMLRACFAAAVTAADPARVLAAHLPERPAGRVVVVGAGKAAASMAAAVEAAWPDVALTGVVVTRTGHAMPTRRIRVIEASHPVPDEAGRRGAAEVLAAVRGLSPGDLVLALVSGGGSALLPAPAPGLTLADEQAVARALLASGAPIGEMNAVRTQLSAIKGGRLLAAASPARVVTLAVSDVPGDDPAIIASGPTVPATAPRAAAAAILARHGITPPPAVAALLASPEPPAAATGPVDYRLIATPLLALRAAAEVARKAGLIPVILGDAIEGEAREVGTVMAGIAASVRRHGHPGKPPALLLSGGETTVTGTARGGMGGRNTTFALGLALALSGRAGTWAIAGDTDGIDGTGPHAGALVTPDTLFRAEAAGRDPRRDLDENDSGGLFASLGDLVHTGPTLTNVNDIRAILVA